MKRRSPAFIILIFSFWYYSTIKDRKKSLLQDIFHKVRVINLTQGGLKAMEALEELEEERRQGKVHTGGRSIRTPVPKGTASNEMCTFLIINISSLQLIPVNIIAYRSQYGSVNPAVIVGPAIAATMVSTAVAIVYCKVVDGKRRA